MVAKKNDGDGEDLIEVVRRGLRRSTPQLRILLIEQVLVGLIDGGDWGSMCWLHGETERALMRYFRTLDRTDRGVRQEAWRNLGPGLQERLKGKIEVERAVR
jgi:hypothetical protein